ncbi:hypothetical protein L1987_75251 [Smallanthus sonchifolius]|uniref:Uncharacterized protein n=1 Tax=Smallanthus sonchifolius TaxID=185202 RepID=A0ACB9A4X9_9ASTR|nr:hypothetical protein L1987_75251 [Smallanthus sonchifolius]
MRRLSGMDWGSEGGVGERGVISFFTNFLESLYMQTGETASITCEKSRTCLLKALISSRICNLCMVEGEQDLPFAGLLQI